MKYENIAIIGMSGRFPEAENLQEFWDNLAAGRDSIREFPESRREELRETFGAMDERYVKNGYLDRIADFDPAFFGISKEEARFMDPQQRLALELLEEAIQDSGYRSDELSKRRVSVYLASAGNQYGTLLKDHPMGVVNVLDSALAGRIAYFYDFRGPAITVNTACSSSLVALHMACMSLIQEESEVAVVGGCQVFVLPAPWNSMKDYPVFAKSEVLSAFGEGADGTLGGEGGGMLVLKRLVDAEKDGDSIHAIIRGSGTNSDAGRSNGLSAPSPAAQGELIRDVLGAASVEAETVSYVEAHGTGTELGDPIEVEGISSVFRQCATAVRIGSVKTNIGHLVGLAGLAGLTKVVLSMQNEKLAPSLHFERPNPHIDFEKSNVRVQTKLEDWKGPRPLRAGVSSFGIIGTNSHVLLEEAPSSARSKSERQAELFVISARSEESLRKYAKSLRSRLETLEEAALSDVAATLACGRKAQRVRAAFVVSSLSELKSSLEQFAFHEVGVVLPELFFAAGAIEEPRFGAAVQSVVLARDLGIVPRGVMGWEQGRLVAGVASGNLSEKDVLSEYNRGKFAPEDGEKLLAKFREVILPRFPRISFWGAVPPALEGLVDELKDERRVLFPLEGEHAFLQFIAQCFLDGHDVHFEKMFGTFKRVSLPPVPFEKEQYFARLSDLRPDLRAEVRGEKKQLQEEPSTRAGRIPRRAELLSMFQEMLPEPIDESKAFVDLGGDSILALELSERVRKTYSSVPESWSVLDAGSVGAALDDVCGHSSEDESSDAAGAGGSTDRALRRLLEFLPPGAKVENGFFENGGDSISVVECRDALESEFGIHLSSDALYADIPLGELFAGAPHGRQSDESRHSPSSLLPPYSFVKGASSVFLTGATGFLGAHVLAELLRGTEHHVTCLVRGRAQQSGRARLLERLRFYFGSELDVHLDRFDIVEGDASQSLLGLEERVYGQLASTMTQVLHCAADVRQVAPRAELEAANVDATRRMIEFCETSVRKRLHHCSTYVVSGRFPAPRTFSEEDLDCGQLFLGNEYARTKYQAELLVREAKARGLSAVVHRVGNLSGRLSDGVFQANATDSLIHSSLQAVAWLRCYPRALADLELEMSPVDHCAKMLVRAVCSEEVGGRVFHWMNPHPVRLGEVFKFLPESRLVESESLFRDRLASEVRNEGCPTSVRRLGLFFRSDPSADAQQTYQPSYDFAATDAFIGEEVWSKIADGYLERLVKSVVPQAERSGHS